MSTANPPPLAQYFDLSGYLPLYGDYVVWAGWFSTWHGYVVDFDPKTNVVSIIFAGLPFLLLTLDTSEQTKETRLIKLEKIRLATKGTWAVLRHAKDHNTIVWYI